MKDKKFAKAYVNRDGSIMRLSRLTKMVIKFKEMNFIEQQNFLMAVKDHLQPKPTPEHTFHHFISKRGKPHNTTTG